MHGRLPVVRVPIHRHWQSVRGSELNNRLKRVVLGQVPFAERLALPVHFLAPEFDSDQGGVPSEGA